ncbi:MAG: MerR family transcriptional regulator [Bacteroidota bacterium]
MKKLYYSIGEVSEITGVEPHVLRYWETIFEDLSPGKNSGGKRIYKEEHLNVALRLKELIREEQYSTAGAKQILQQEAEEGNQSNSSSAPAMDVALKRDLKEIRYFLSNLLDRL